MADTELITIKEAAERLGVSPDTVRRRLKRGELTGEQASTPQGFVWRVAFPTGESMASEKRLAPDGSDAIELAQLRERVAGLERERAEIIAQRDAWHEQAQRESEAAREFRVLLRNEQMRSLPAETMRQDAPGAADSPPHDAQVSEQRNAPAATRRHFWDRLRRT